MELIDVHGGVLMREAQEHCLAWGSDAWDSLSRYWTDVEHEANVQLHLCQLQFVLCEEVVLTDFVHGEKQGHIQLHS